jgi:hypothetical protein
MADLTPQESVEFVALLADHLSDLGFEDSANQLRAWTASRSVACGDGLEALGSICQRIMRRDGDRFPPCLRNDLQRCMRWPDATV